MTAPEHNADIMVELYRDADDKVRWRIRSSARGRRILADSGQGYSRKTDAIAALLLVTDGKYTEQYRTQLRGKGVYTQGIIERFPWHGGREIIFVEYVGWAEA